MEKLINYLFYCQHRLYVRLTYSFLFAPLYFVINNLPISRRRKDVVKKSYIKRNQENDISISFSYSFIFISLLFFFSSLTLIITFLIHINFVKIIYSLFLLVSISTYFTVYFFLMYEKKYIIYFEKFELLNKSKLNYLVIICYYLVIFLFTFLSIRYTWGFKLKN